jgi:hypothetical protein
LFGPFQAAASWRQLVFSLLSGALIGGALVGILRTRCSVRRGTWVVLISLLELVLAQAWMIQTGHIPASFSTVNKARQERLYRSDEGPGYPGGWTLQSSPGRLRDLQRWEFATLRPKYHLLTGWGSLLSRSALQNADYAAVLDVLKRISATPDKADTSAQSAVLNLFGASLLIVATEDRSVVGAIENDSHAEEAEHRTDRPVLHRYRNPAAFPRAWIVHNWQRFDPPGPSASELRTHTAEVLFPQGPPRDFSVNAVVEGVEGDVPPPPPNSSGANSAGEACRIVRCRPELVELETTLLRPGLIVLADQYSSDWKVYVAGGRVGGFERRPLLRTNRVLRGIHLEAGKYTVQFRFEPRAAHLGVLTMSVAWALLVLFAVGRLLRRNLGTGAARSGS